jgi:uncharacterized protein
MTNHLATENSPYLLQHSENPVDWYPWGSEAFEKARQEERPIFLSIGYAACHWCHVMAHESFEDATTAALMNDLFVNIKVDREERPDLDSIYMNAVVAQTGRGGWPMSVFLSPDGLPFFGGTYFPPRPRYGMPAFRDVLIAVAQEWQHNRKELLKSGQELLRQIQSSYTAVADAVPGVRPLDPDYLDEAADRLLKTYDWQSGGWGTAPKFPQPMAIEFLLRRADKGKAQALSAARHCLDAMDRGGLYDLLGGGFARYSTDDIWRAPHFEKMLYDNAQLALVYLHAHLMIGEDAYRQVCKQTLAFMQREMSRPGATGVTPGGFFSSLDADSEGQEGKYYLWTAAEIRSFLENSPAIDKQFISYFFEAHQITEAGNFEGKVILQRVIGDQELAEKYSIDQHELACQFNLIQKCLLQARSQRTPPATDDKILTAWNGLALITFAEAARYLRDPSYLQTARTTANFILEELYKPGCLYRSWRNGRARHPGYLEDYAALVLGLLELYQVDPDLHWYSMAEKLTAEMQANFADPDVGFFDTRQDQESLIVRPKDLQDNATPCGNSLAALALLKLSHLNGDDNIRQQAKKMILHGLKLASKYPTAFAMWLSAADFAFSDVYEVALIGNLDTPEAHRMVDLLWKNYQPNRIVACSPFPPPPGAPALVRERTLLNGLPTAYVCHEFTCKFPVTSAQDLERELTL